MALNVSVVVATYGSENAWVSLADRAMKSAVAETGRADRVVRYHRADATLAEARNEAVDLTGTEWVCILDADDELEAGYLEALASIESDLRAPYVRYVRGARALGPASIPAGTADMADGNRLVIGTLFRREAFDAVGGFREWPFYEDWDLWQRMWLAGATIGFSDRAVYRAHVRLGSRNRAPSRQEKERVHHDIRRANMPWLYQEAQR